jgi:beta-lactam-binding protein with PASTA domain
MRNRRSPAGRTRVDQEVAGPPIVEEDEYAPPPRPPLPKIWPWLLLLLLVVIGGLLGAYFLIRENGNKKSSASAVTVPAVVGLKQSNAIKQLDERGLVPQLATGPSKVPAGTVFAQDPGAGTSLNRGSLVKVSVSSAAQISVPNVVGSRTSVAVARLKDAGLQSRVTTVAATAAPGVVVKQTPVAGTRVAKGSTVALNVSKGGATVPDVRGQPASDAKAALQTAGLVPVEFKVPSAQPKGTVTAQNPLPNKTVPRGSKVRVNVSAGSASASTPGTTTSGTTTTAASARTLVPLPGRRSEASNSLLQTRTAAALMESSGRKGPRLSFGAMSNLVTVCYLVSYGSHSGRAGSAGKRPRSSRSVSSSSLEKCSPKISRMLPTCAGAALRSFS